MDFVTLALSIAILTWLFWLHRRVVERAYAAGWDAALADQDRRERHGLAELPEDTSTT